MRHRFHSLCPYFAMFPEAFAATWIERLSAPDELVLDPFCGRGTTPFQALLMGRRAIGNDINPVAYCLTRAKTNSPSAASLRARVTRLERVFRSSPPPSLSGLPPFFQHAFADSTLTQILFLRASLRWQRSDVDCMLAALILGILHGESDKSSSILSNQMPRTISTKPNYSIRFWQQRGSRPPERDAFGLIRRQITFRYASQPPAERAMVLAGDFRELHRRLASVRGKVRLMVTSPPYLNVTNFEEDQWLRIWFLGGAPHPTYRKISRDDRHEDPGRYWQLIGDLWRVAGTLLAPKGHLVVRIGGRKLENGQITEGLRASGVFSGRKIRLVSSESSEIRNRQTGSFRPGSKGCSQEVDCCFQVV
jgi:hypothetical protein